MNVEMILFIIILYGYVRFSYSQLLGFGGNIERWSGNHVYDMQYDKLTIIVSLTLSLDLIYIKFDIENGLEFIRVE